MKYSGNFHTTKNYRFALNRNKVSHARRLHARGPQGGWTVRIGHPGPLPRLADLFRELVHAFERCRNIDDFVVKRDLN